MLGGQQMCVVVDASGELLVALNALGMQELLQLQMSLRLAMGRDVSVEVQVTHGAVVQLALLALAHALQAVELNRLELLGDLGLLADHVGLEAVALLNSLAHHQMGASLDVVLERVGVPHVLLAQMTVEHVVWHTSVGRLLGGATEFDQRSLVFVGEGIKKGKNISFESEVYRRGCVWSGSREENTILEG